jgi:hypothetical protein
MLDSDAVTPTRPARIMIGVYTSGSYATAWVSCRE